LYKSFAEEEYEYLRDRRVDNEENIFEFCISLPHSSSPSVLNGTSKETFLTKMEWHLLGSVDAITGKEVEAVTFETYANK